MFRWVLDKIREHKAQREMLRNLEAIAAENRLADQLEHELRIFHQGRLYERSQMERQFQSYMRTFADLQRRDQWRDN